MRKILDSELIHISGAVQANVDQVCGHSHGEYLCAFVIFIPDSNPIVGCPKLTTPDQVFPWAKINYGK